jgi:hypothetical protein
MKKSNTKIGRLLPGLLATVICCIAPRAYSNGPNRGSATVVINISPYQSLLWINSDGTPITNSTYDLGTVTPTGPTTLVNTLPADGFLAVQSNQGFTIHCPDSLVLRNGNSPGIQTDASISLLFNNLRSIGGSYSNNGSVQALSLPAGYYPGPQTNPSNAIEVQVQIVNQTITMANQAGLYQGTLTVTLSVP